MGCCTSIAKYALFVLNFVFWLAGVGLLGVGIWFKVDPNVNNIVSVAGISIYVGAYASIALGVFMLVVGFCGCCGAIKENRCLLWTYFTFVLLVFLVQVGVAIWGFVSHTSIESAIKTGLNNSVPINSTTNNDAIIAIQKTFKCCGLVNGCKDWANRNASGCSCEITSTSANDTCSVGPDQCTNADNPGKPIYSKDCYDAIYKFIQDNIMVIAWVILGVALSEIFVMIFAAMVAQAAKAKYETV